MANSKISALTSATTPLAGTETLPVVQSGATKQVSVANLTAGRAVAVDTLAATSGVYVGVSAPVYGEVSNIVSSNNVFLYSLARNTSSGSSAYAGTVFNAYGNSWTIRTGSIAANSNALDVVVDALGSLTKVASWSTTGDYTISNGNLIQGTAAKGINFTANTGAAGMTSQLLNWYEEGTFTPTMIGATTSGTTTYSNQLGFYTRIGNRVMFNLTVVWTAATGTGQMLIGGLPFTSASSGLHAVVPCTISLGVGNITQIMPRIVTSATSIQMQRYAAGAVTDINVEATGTVVLSGQYRV